MLQQYQTETYAFVALLVVILIYIIIKRRTSKAELIQIKPQESKEKELLDEYDTPEKNNETPQKDKTQEKNTDIKDFQRESEDSQEKIFKQTPQQRQSDKIESIQTKHLIPKRDVPPHGKITKENFKEFAGTRILVAEDNFINQKVIKGLLADTGIEIVMADDGQECLNILERDKDFLLVLMDVHMPRVDGFEATRAIRANPECAHILVVALSGDTAADDIKKMSEAGMNEQLEKPLRMEALYDIFYAYTSEESTEKEEFVHTIITKELHRDKGLEICGGDETFYHEILNEFVSVYGNSTQELGNLLRSGNLQAADKLLLDIIGVTANIGAQNLNKISHIIKASLSDAAEKSYLTLIQQYKTSLDNLLKDIKGYK